MNEEKSTLKEEKRVECPRVSSLGFFMEKLKIYVDRLKNGHKEVLDLQLPPASLHIVDEKELTFPLPVQIHGEVYLADDHLVICLSLNGAASLPCSICNERVNIPLEVKKSYTTVPLEEIPSALYDLTEEIRETLLLQVPPFIECHGGTCPERSEIKKFMVSSTETPEEPPSQSTHYFPFADL